VIRFGPFPVHVADVDPVIFLDVGYIIEPVEHHWLTKMDAMDSIIFATCDAYCTIQLLWNMHSRLHFQLQLLVYNF
jgi:hypothetical protein